MMRFKAGVKGLTKNIRSVFLLNRSAISEVASMIHECTVNYKMAMFYRLMSSLWYGEIAKKFRKDTVASKFL